MRETILVVEDEPSIADVITYALSSEGFSPVWVKTGGEALLALSGGVSMIILDLGLPDVSGFDLLKAVRRERPVPVIIVTARNQETDKVVGLELGADDYVVKPFSPRELTARVRAVLRRAAESGQGEVFCDAPHAAAHPATPFRVDQARFSISYFGHPLPLSRQEFRLLALLLQNPGRVFTRDNLLDLVWNGTLMSGDRTVDSHIKSIRKKLKAVRGDMEPIVTHRGWGYSVSDRLLED
ncbi:MAG: two-component system response regulator CreB [Deltaproteobacteria bacterium]|nr:two-component system response regulator CreB [Deltaproteobacteria bacterium]